MLVNDLGAKGMFMWTMAHQPLKLRQETLLFGCRGLVGILYKSFDKYKKALTIPESLGLLRGVVGYESI